VCVCVCVWIFVCACTPGEVAQAHQSRKQYAEKAVFNYRGTIINFDLYTWTWVFIPMGGSNTKFCRQAASGGFQMQNSCNDMHVCLWMYPNLLTYRFMSLCLYMKGP